MQIVQEENRETKRVISLPNYIAGLSRVRCFRLLRVLTKKKNALNGLRFVENLYLVTFQLEKKLSHSCGKPFFVDGNVVPVV